MIIKTSTKKQHYVPQFLLKRFSLDRKTIKVYQKDEGRTIKNASIRDQCSKKWFYGKGNTEAKLSQIEGNGANAIKKVSEGKKISLDERNHLYQFINLQSIRTFKKVNLINETRKKFKKEILRAVSAIGGLGDIDEIEGIDGIIEENLIMTPEELINSSEYDYRKILDLDFVILKTKNLEKEEQDEFVIGDSPVIHYNYYFECFNGGLNRYGEMIIMPLSPYETIVLYDKRIYEFHNVNKNKILFINTEDIHKLNKLQYVHCSKNIYFKTILDEQRDYFKTLNIEKKPKIFKTSQIIGVNLDDIQFINVELSFFSITKEGIDLKNVCLQQMDVFREIHEPDNVSKDDEIKFASPLFRDSPKSVADIRREIYDVKIGKTKVTYFS